MYDPEGQFAHAEAPANRRKPKKPKSLTVVSHVKSKLTQLTGKTTSHL